MKDYSLYLLCCICLASCGHRQFQKEMEQLTAKEIVIPKGMKQMLAGRDTVVLDYTSGVPGLIIWTDSTACSSCSLDKMFEYAEIIDFREETKEGFLPLFVFSPPHAKVRELFLALQTPQFNYPVFIDESNAFSKANPHIPADNRFHTFLIDKNGKVILVGDPVNNPQLWELYKTTITELIANGGTMPDVEKKE